MIINNENVIFDNIFQQNYSLQKLVVFQQIYKGNMLCSTVFTIYFHNITMGLLYTQWSWLHEWQFDQFSKLLHDDHCLIFAIFYLTTQKTKTMNNTDLTKTRGVNLGAQEGQAGPAS